MLHIYFIKSSLKFVPRGRIAVGSAHFHFSFPRCNQIDFINACTIIQLHQHLTSHNSTFLSTFYIYPIFNLLSCEYGILFHCVLKFIFQVINNVGYLFICILTTLLSSLQYASLCILCTFILRI